MQYELQLNLQQRAALSAAISLWKKEEFKDKVKEFLCSSTLNKDEARDEWKRFTKTVFEESNQNVLPPTLKNELIHFVRGIGETIYNWYLNIWRDNEFPFEGWRRSDYSDEIYWTPYGTVDEVAIFKSFLSKNPSPHIDETYHVACCYTLKEQINDLWRKMPKDMKTYCDEDINEYIDRHILAYWKYRRDGELSDLIEYFDDIVHEYGGVGTNEYNFLYNPNHSPEENMLLASASEGYHIAIKYFWNKLTEEKRNRSVVSCAYMAIKCYNYYDLIEKTMHYGYKKEKYVETCLFLINQMTEDQRESFFKKGSILDGNCNSWDEEKDVKNTVLRMLLSVWQWRELVVPVFNDMLKYLEYDRKTIRMFLYNITSKMIEDHKLGFAAEKSKYQSILHTVWHLISGPLKRNKTCLGLSVIIANLLEVQDLRNLKLIIDDPEVADMRDQYIECGRKGFLKLILNDQYEILDQFMKEILRSDEEKKSFKQKINIWGNSTLDDQFYTADKLLNDRFCVLAEGENCESGRNYIRLEEYFMSQQRYDLAEKFLNWKSKTEEEKQIGH